MHVASFDSRLKGQRIVSMQSNNSKLSCYSPFRKCNHSTCKLFCLYIICFLPFKPEEWIECQKNKQEVKLFRVVLKIVFVSMQMLTFQQTEIYMLAFFLRLFDLLRIFYFIYVIFVKAEFFLVNLCFQKEKTLRKCVFGHFPFNPKVCKILVGSSNGTSTISVWSNWNIRDHAALKVVHCDWSGHFRRSD